jgi:uncharacterized protein YndB with AHSA1/START domain
MRIKPGVALLAIAFWPIAVNALGAEENRVLHEGIVVAPLDEVWRAFTTNAGQESWMVAHCGDRTQDRRPDADPLRPQGHAWGSQDR